MDIRPLRYFLTIVDEGQITQAAKKLNIAQPPLSKQLKILEDRLGTTLIARDGKRFELTESGKILYKNGKIILHLLDQTMKEINEASQGLRGTLTIGVAKTCTSILVDRIKRFNQQYPNVKFDVLDGTPTHLEEYLQKHEIELAIIRTPTDLENYSFIHLGNDPIVYVTPKSWTFNTTSQIGMKEVSERPFIKLQRFKGSSNGINELIENEFKKRKLHPKVICESNDVNIVLSLVETGMGATILPKSAIQSHPVKDVNIIEIKDCFINTDIFLIWLKDNYLSKISEHFIDMVQ